MKKILLIAVVVSLLAQACFAATLPLYKGNEYPIKADTSDKLLQLSRRISDLQGEIFNLNFPDNEPIYLTGELLDDIDQVASKLVLEERHSRDRQFDIDAISDIDMQISSSHAILESVPDLCLKNMGQSNISPAEVVYYGKIKDITKEALDLLQEIQGELAEFK